MILDLVIIGCTTLISSWTWSIFSQNLFIGICCILLSFLLLLNFNNDKLVLPQRFLQIGIICFWLIISGYLLTASFDKNLIHISENQYINVLKRQEIYSREFGHFYKNRFGIYYFNKIKPFIYRYLNNTSKLFDLDNLFISKLPLLFLPFMISGLFYLQKTFNKKYGSVMIIILVIAGLLDAKNILGPIIVYPIIYASIGLGFSKLLNLIR